ncbi:unnamed protein product [Arctogadus glacialis]
MDCYAAIGGTNISLALLSLSGGCVCRDSVNDGEERKKTRRRDLHVTIYSIKPCCQRSPDPLCNLRHVSCLPTSHTEKESWAYTQTLTMLAHTHTHTHTHTHKHKHKHKHTHIMRVAPTVGRRPTELIPYCAPKCFGERERESVDVGWAREKDTNRITENENVHV